MSHDRGVSVWRAKPDSLRTALTFEVPFCFGEDPISLLERYEAAWKGGITIQEVADRFGQTMPSVKHYLAIRTLSKSARVYARGRAFPLHKLQRIATLPPSKQLPELRALG